ncbi:undecaprenyldiphospho-muramoylpentapeptide beta-N-acetylglucosaminyltransferase [Desulfonatronovibrio magnus]|uniref:undecaprenyldiphospho-muramoylpentapeptide beta-N-acetylglucosaminyltransferase n=1 Tax=Desulfonatronovibrio magnus TaxID=698827 RepID=UPI0005EB1644
MLKKVLLTTGGTGGHIFPAIATAQKISEMYPGCEIVFAGGEYGPEREITQKAGIKFKAFPARGVLGRGIRSLGAMVWMVRSLAQSMKFIRSFKPQIVIGFGGYAGFMPVLAARWLKYPTAIHEQNSIPGVTNRILSKRVDKVMLSFPDINGYFPPEKTVQTGNPVRREFVEASRNSPELDRHKRRLLVLGGSQGARAVNDAVVSSLSEFKALGVEIWHQTGQNDFARVQKVYDREFPEARVEPFIDNMVDAYSFATLVLCRAGASTISELCAMGRPSVLVPFPYATHDHQMINARHLEGLGAALVLAQSYLSEIHPARVIGDLLAAPDKLRNMGKAAMREGKAEAAEEIVKQIEYLVSEKQGKTDRA